MLKKKKWILLSISLWLLGSCALTPPDVYVFEPLDQFVGIDDATGHLVVKASPTCWEKIQELYCGHGVAIMTGDQIFIGNEEKHFFNGKSWDTLRNQSVLVPAVESYAPIATYIINSCKKLNCSKDVTKFQVKLDELSSIIK